MVLLWKQAELMRTTSNYGVYYSMYLSKRCSLCVLEILPCRFKGTSLQEVRHVFFFSKYNFFLSRSSFPTVMATEWKCVDCFDGFKSFLCPYKCIWNLNYTSKRIAHESKQVWIEIMKFTAHHTKEIGLRDYSISGSISMATLGLPSHFPWSITTSWLHVTKW